ncbi:hypothetical protein ACC690_38310, partial [Rhizobium johnstonii]|uniref:hypothetical protein n=1 Tax=Rhizobium johnstonii TaxID=3019933 RepID=UPI003F9525BA
QIANCICDRPTEAGDLETNRSVHLLVCLASLVRNRIHAAMKIKIGFFGVALLGGLLVFAVGYLMLPEGKVAARVSE